jgi:uroporphyrinogen decarboxylase
VMSDFAYPRPAGKWYEPRVEANPFPRQLRALELIRQGLNGDAYFIETIFNSWNVAEKLSSKEELNRLKNEQPQKLLDALDVITRSQINHVRLAQKTGASGFLVSVANANQKELALQDYRKFSQPFDRRIIAAAAAPLTMLHLHVEPAYLDFFQGFEAPVINYSDAVSGIPIATVRARFSQVIAGGIDEVHYRELDNSRLRAQYESARKAAGPEFILTPGCSVPDDSSPDELARLPQLLGA